MQIIDVGDPNWWLSIKFVDCSPPASVSTVFFSKAVAIQRRSLPMSCATAMLSVPVSVVLGQLCLFICAY